MNVLSFGLCAEHEMRAQRDWAEAMTPSSRPPPLAPKPRLASEVAALDRLPDELKLQILRHTGPNPFVLARMQLVSRDWRRLAQDDSLWEPLYPRAFVPTSVGPAAATQVAPKPPQTRLAVHMQNTNALRQYYFRNLWSGDDKPAMIWAGSHDAIFACHAFLVLGPEWRARRAWFLESRARENALMQDSIWLQVLHPAALH